MPQTIAYRVGTYRPADPERTWERVQPVLPKVGISRVADITRLDDIGLPVHVAYRPTSLTYAVSIGTGLTAAQSKVSAVMESIETWHAENLELPIAARAPAAALDLGYDVRSLHLAHRSPLTSSVVLDWVSGPGLLTGQELLAPIDYIRLDGTAPRHWARALFFPTSNGMATGNTAADAVLHGLLELIERDSVAGFQAAAPSTRRYVDPASCGDPRTRQIYEALRSAGCVIAVGDATGPVGLPAYAAVVWSPDVPIRCGGYGCHVDPAIALGRAMAEAAQSRLAVVSGARDDVDAGAYEEVRRPAVPAELASVGDRPAAADDGDLESVIAHCAAKVAAVTGVEPFAVRLDHEDIGIPAVKVLAPGLRMIDAHRSSPASSSSVAPPTPAEAAAGAAS
ncbi:MAG TPA: YcaO-like family protein [Streptosporangiaceae bacterium]|jgi:ribosomal protein S12 methylthiotransferase accessory factor|nr:YcaO-like family protein [Streptosporangiaceae bacterium]